MLTPSEIETLVNRIVERARPHRVIMFGSYVKGTATDRSDLDLLVECETVLPMARRATDLSPICSGFLVPIDLHVYTQEEVREYGREEFHFLHTVTRTGKVLYTAPATSPTTG